MSRLSALRSNFDQSFLLGEQGRLVGLDGLRAFAVVLVFCVHLFGTHYQSDYYVDPQSLTRRICWTLHAGYIGVDLFFVLSGFLAFLSMTRSNTQAGDSRRFLEKRFRRLIPAFFWTLVVFEVFGRKGVWIGTTVGVLGLAIYSLFRRTNSLQMCRNSFYRAFPNLVIISFLSVALLMVLFRQVVLASNDLLPYLTYLVNFMFLWQFFVDFRKMNSVIWTLSIQVLFYYVIAAFVWLRSKRISASPKILIPAILAAYGTQWFVPDAISPFGLRWDPTNTVCRSMAFLGGIVIARLYTTPQLWQRLRSLTSVLSVFCLLLVPLMQFVRHNVVSTLHWPGHLDFAVYYLVLDIILVVIVAGTLIPGSALYKLFSSKPLRFLGVVSYSFFLIHTLVISYTVPAFAPYSFVRMWGHFFVSLCGSIIIAAVMFYFLERPYFDKR
jgi:peptidoglycan/LPS O-acetylase OafA/YrhL